MRIVFHAELFAQALCALRVLCALCATFFPKGPPQRFILLIAFLS
jgi:hypothetical protein